MSSQTRREHFWQSPILALIFFSIAGCSGGSSGISGIQQPAAASPAATVPAVAYTAAPLDCTGCWPTYAQNFERTGFQAQTNITSSNVANLTPLWAQPINEQIVTSPVVDDGMVFIGTGAGNVYAFNQSNGTIVWKRNLGGPILETATIDHGMLFVGTHSPPSNFYALNVETGSTMWQDTISGDFRGPAAVSNGVVYVGEAGGDPPVCDPGGLHAYAESTGAQLFFWRTDPKPNDGGAVWTPITIDGPNIVFGTGNTCTDGIANSNSLMRLATDGLQEWEAPNGSTSVTDDDWGGGILVYGNNYYAANKNGYLYATARATGAVVWKTLVSPVDGQGSIGTPTTDGTVLIVPSGNLQVVSDGEASAANFTAYTLSGAQLWTYPFTNLQRNYAPIANGVAYLAADTQIVAVNAHTGTKLWSYSSAGGVEYIGAPAITPVGLFTADTDGAVIAFAPATSSADAAKSQIAIRRGTLYEPYGPIVTEKANGAYQVKY